MRRDDVSILADLKSNHGQCSDCFNSSPKQQGIMKMSFYLFWSCNRTSMLKIIFGLYAEIMQAFRPTLNRTTADVVIVFIYVRNINVKWKCLFICFEVVIRRACWRLFWTMRRDYVSISADVAIVFIHVRNINVNENVLSFVLEL